jgi:hypothetical protein
MTAHGGEFHWRVGQAGGFVVAIGLLAAGPSTANLDGIITSPSNERWSRDVGERRRTWSKCVRQWA